MINKIKRRLKMYRYNKKELMIIHKLKPREALKHSLVMSYQSVIDELNYLVDWYQRKGKGN